MNKNDQQRDKNNHKRYNRRHDGVTTIQSTPERHKLEEAQLKKQWDQFRTQIDCYNEFHAQEGTKVNAASN